MRITSFILAVCAMLAVGGAAGAAPGDGGTSDFYRWNDAVPARPGLLLRHEPLPVALGLAGAGKAERILYASTRGWGRRAPIATSGEIFLPKGTAPKGGWPIIAWAHGTTGIADICAPSWTAPSPRDATYLNAWLAQGYAIVATDYEGLGTPGPHPYMGMKSAAYSVLDAVRAARRAFPELGSAIVVVGQSQGAHAALAAGLVAPQYAPELDIRGVVATGVPGEKGFEAAADALPSDRIAKAVPIDPDTPRSRVRGLRLDRFDGWALVYFEYFASYGAVEPGFRPAAWLTPRGMALFDELKAGRQGPVTHAFLAEKPPLSAVFRKNPTVLEWRHAGARRYPDPAFAMPVFFGIGLADSYTAPELAFNVARSACLRGSRIQVRFYPGLGHAETVLPSQRDSSLFVRAVFAGETPPDDCATLAWPGRR